MQKNHFILLFLCSCVLVSAHAQDFNFIQFSQREGLHHSQVLSIAQDSNGNLWVGTATRSIYRFDGREFFEYKIHIPNFTGTLNALSVKPDMQNQLWIISNLGLLKFNGKETRLIPTSGNAQLGTNSTIVVDQINRKWLIDEKGSLFHLHNDTLKSADNLTKKVLPKIVGFSQKPSGSVCFYLLDGSLATIDSDGVAQMQAGIWSKHKPLEFAGYEGGQYLIANKDSLFVYTDSFRLVSKFRLPQYTGIVRQVVRDRNDVIWVLDGNKVFTLDKGGRSSLVSGSSDLVKNDAIFLFQDADKGIWLSVDVEGILKSKKQVLHKVAGTDGYDITSVIESPEGDLLYGTYGSGILGQQNVRLAGKAVTSLAFDSDGQLYAGTLKDGAFEIWNGMERRIFPKHSGYMDVHGISSPGDSVLIGSSNGLFILSGERVLRYAKKGAKSIETRSPTLVNSEVYFTSVTEGLMKLTGDSIVQVGPDFLKQSTVYSIRQQQSGNYAVFGEFSQVVWFDENFNYLRTVDLSKTVSNILLFEEIDTAHWLVGSNDGLFKVTIAADTLKAVRKYGKVDGYNEEELYVGASVSTKNKTIVIGTVRGAYKFTPAFEDTMVVPPHTYIMQVEYRSLSSFDSTKGYFSLPSNLKLDYAENLITFGFSASSLTNPYNIQYQYKLEGISIDWSPPTTSQKVTYSNLLPGNYTFWVQALDQNKTLGSISKYSFSVLPAFWQTTWFYVFIGIAIVVMVLLSIIAVSAYRVRQHKLEDQLRHNEAAKIRKQMSMDFHDEMGNKLAGMLTHANLLKTKNKGSELESVFDYFERSAFAIFHGTKDFIWTIDMSSNNLSEVILYLRDFGLQFFERNGILFHVKDNILEPNFQRTLPVGTNRQIILIFKEAMTNSLKHANCKNVFFSLSMSGSEFEIVFEDDGIWCDESTTGNGIRNMHQRAAKIDAVFSITRENEKSKVSLIVKNKAV